MSSFTKTPCIKIVPGRAYRAAITKAARIVREGGLVAFPTETVYGIAANLLDKRAMQRLRKVKRRPRGKPFTVHIATTEMIRRMGCEVNKEARAAMARYWPGPLTVVVKSSAGKKIGFRMPANRIALDLIRQARVPVVAPSANIGGQKPPTSARSVLAQLNGALDLVIDGGETDVGVESTVVDFSVKPFVVLREGAISRQELNFMYDIRNTNDPATDRVAGERRM